MSLGTFGTLFATSEEEEQLGKWFKLGKGTEVRVRRASSKKSKKAREALEAEYGAGKVKLTDEVMDELNIEHLARGILADWKGVKDDEGKELPFTVKNAIEAMTKYPDFKNLVVNFSVDMDNFRAKINEDVEGN